MFRLHTTKLKYSLRVKRDISVVSEDMENIKGRYIRQNFRILDDLMNVTDVKAGVHVKAVLTSLNTAFLPISRSRFKRH